MRTKGGDSNLRYEKRGLASGVFQKDGTTWKPVAGMKHRGFSCLAGSDSIGGCLKDASCHTRGLKALAATCLVVRSTCAQGHLTNSLSSENKGGDGTIFYKLSKRKIKQSVLLVFTRTACYLLLAIQTKRLQIENLF